MRFYKKSVFTYDVANEAAEHSTTMTREREEVIRHDTMAYVAVAERRTICRPLAALQVGAHQMTDQVTGQEMSTKTRKKSVEKCASER